MDEATLEPTRESVLEEIKKCRQKIGTLLMIYFMVVLLQVVSGAGSLLLLFLETAGGMSILGKALFAALPLLMWFYSQRPSSTGGVLMFYAVVEGIQAAILLAVVSAGSFFFGFDGPSSVAMLPFVVLVVFGVVGGLLVLFVKLFRSARRLGQLMAAVGGASGNFRAACLDAVMVVVAIVCYLAPALPTWDSLQSSMNLRKDLNQALKVKTYRVGEAIDCMAGSPDGGLLALGTEKGLYVWDTERRECVWSDDCLAVQRVRFSPGGRYLAAAGRGRAEGASDLAVYEVEGFRRLPGFEWPEYEEHKEKVFHDMVFRPDEETLLVLWHRTWVWYRIGWGSDEADAVREREKDLGHDLDTVDLFCTEGNIKKNALSSFRRIRKGLSVDFDLCIEGSAYFASDASCFVYSIEGMQKEFNRFCLMDTEKWQEQLFHLSGYQLILWGIKPWYEWRLNANGTRAYLLCRKELKEGGYEGVLLELDLQTGRTRELKSRGWRLALSADGEQVVMLAGNNQVSGVVLIALNFLNLDTLAEKQLLYKVVQRDQGDSWRFIWLKPRLFAVAMKSEYGGTLTFIDLKEGEDK